MIVSVFLLSVFRYAWLVSHLLFCVRLWRSACGLSCEVVKSLRYKEVCMKPVLVNNTFTSLPGTPGSGDLYILEQKSTYSPNVFSLYMNYNFYSFLGNTLRSREDDPHVNCTSLLPLKLQFIISNCSIPKKEVKMLINVHKLYFKFE